MHTDEAFEVAQALVVVARRAGELLLRGYRSRPRADEKAEKDLVTEWDTRSQDLVLELIAAALPGVGVVAEEGVGDPHAPGPGLVVAVDPLDGTTNFVHGHPFYCVSLGALHDGHPVAGAIVAPSLGVEWLGAAGEGGGRALRGGVPCRVSDTAELRRAMVATGFPPERDEAPWNNFDSFIRVKKRSRCVRRCGSAAIDLAFVADGTYDGYWERRLFLWDAVAGAALVHGAGGTISAIDGGAPRWADGHIVASNGRVHEELRRAITAE